MSNLRLGVVVEVGGGVKVVARGMIVGELGSVRSGCRVGVVEG